MSLKKSLKNKRSYHPTASRSSGRSNSTPAIPPRSQSWKSIWYSVWSASLNLGRKRVPVLIQQNVIECGLACLAMVLTYYGRKTTISELRSQYAVGRDGMSALAIVKAARSYGMRVRAISLQENDLRYVRLPAIVHWQFNHFLVVEAWSTRGVDVVDPARGRYRLPLQEFDEGFTGVVITMEPGEDFSGASVPSRPRFLSYITKYVRLAPGTFLQLLGASVLILLIGLALPLFTKLVLDQIVPMKMSDIIPVLGIGILAIAISLAVATLLREWLLAYLRARIDLQMMLDFVEHLLKLPYSFFQERSVGDLLTRLASNTLLRDLLSNQLLSALLDSALVLFYLAILLWLSPPFGMLTLLIGVMQVGLLLASHRPIRNLTSRELAAYGKTQGYLAEALGGIATLKASGAEPRAFERWSNLFFDQLNISLRYNYLSAGISTLLTALRSLAQLGLLWIGAIQVLNGDLTLGTMVALIALASAFFAPLGSLVSSGQQLQLVGAHIDRIGDVAEAAPEQKNQAVRLPPVLSGRIQLDNIRFRYAPDAPDVLRQINLSIEPGQKVAIVGISGSGKSTLGKLLLALYLPTEGQIYYDGLPLPDLNYQELRGQFGVVLQESTLFSGSILSNITLYHPSLDKERVVAAAKTAAIHEDIMAIPMGYETFISEGGSALSGGQRQRLAIARAIAHQPKILLLDEATSHLDVATERKVAKGLEALACTQILIAHRLSTIRSADIIIVLEQGEIVEQGSHQSLLEFNGVYTRLVQGQVDPKRPVT